MKPWIFAAFLLLAPTFALADIADDDSAEAGDDDDGSSGGCSAAGTKVGAGLGALLVATLAGATLRRRQ